MDTFIILLKLNCFDVEYDELFNEKWNDDEICKHITKLNCTSHIICSGFVNNCIVFHTPYKPTLYLPSRPIVVPLNSSKLPDIDDSKVDNKEEMQEVINHMSQYIRYVGVNTDFKFYELIILKCIF